MPSLLPNFESYDALALATLVRNRDISALELLDTVIDRIEAVNGKLNCVCMPAYEEARKTAQQPLPQGPLSGVPLFLKDLILWHEGTPISSGSGYVREYVPPCSSEIVQKLLNAGMIFSGRTLSAEFGVLPTVESSYWGTTHNPWNPAYSTGGSSGGAAALVASRILPLADANDGGGSVRGPASLCGLVGLKPSRGRHSFAPFSSWRFGMGACSCLSLSVRDTAAYLDIISGAAPGTQPLPMPEGGFLADVSLSLSSRKPMRIGILRDDPCPLDVHPECRKAVENTAALCRSLGHEVSDAILPQWSEWSIRMGHIFQKTGAVWLALRVAQQTQSLGRIPQKEEMEAISWASLQNGEKMSALEHVMNLEEMHCLSMEICRTLEPYDVLLTPSVAQPAFRLGYLNPSHEELPHMAGSACAQGWAAYGYYLTLLNATGQPGISLPMHWTPEGMPVGVQCIGRHSGEHFLLRLAVQLEEAQPWMQRLPQIHA